MEATTQAPGGARLPDKSEQAEDRNHVRSTELAQDVLGRVVRVVVGGRAHGRGIGAVPARAERDRPSRGEHRRVEPTERRRGLHNGGRGLQERSAAGGEWVGEARRRLYTLCVRGGRASRWGSAGGGLRVGSAPRGRGQRADVVGAAGSVAHGARRCADRRADGTGLVVLVARVPAWQHQLEW